MNNSNDLKKLIPLHMRMALLITLVTFLLGFMFIPGQRHKEYKPKVQKPIVVEKLPPILQKIVKPPPLSIPRMPIAAKNDREREALTIGKTGFTGHEKTEADVEFDIPDFVPYDTPPRPLNLDEIKRRTPYPEVARRLGIEGTVYLKLLLDKEGNVKKVKLLKPLYLDLDRIAMKMAKELRFTPAMQRDMFIAVWISFPYKFSLE
jgi:protein TonB